MEVLLHSDNDVEHRIEIIVPAAELQTHFDKAYREEGKNIELPGFRRGKVPLQMIKKRFGPAIEAQAIEKLSNDFFKTALEERNITPIGQPVMDDLDYKPGGDLTIRIRYETLPDVQAKDYAGIQLEHYRHDVTDDEVASEIEHLRKQHQVLEEAETADEEGYLVTCDIQMLDAEGNPVEGKLSEDMKFDLGEENLNRDLKAELLNMRTGDEKDIELPYENRDGEEEVERAHLKVGKIERVILPELDDAFAAKATNGKVETMDALREDVLSKLVSYWEYKYKEKLENELIDEIVKRNPVHIPPTILNSVLDDFVEQLRSRYPDKKLPESFNVEEFRKAREPEAIAISQWMYLRESITEQEKLEVDDADLERKAEESSSRTGIDKERLLEFYKSSDRMRNEFLAGKLMAFLKERADITEVNDLDVARTPLAPFVDPGPGLTEEEKLSDVDDETVKADETEDK